jgi:hypothetical protein
VFLKRIIQNSTPHCMGKMQEHSTLKQAVDLVTRALSRVKSLRTLVQSNERRPNPIQENVVGSSKQRYEISWQGLVPAE